MRPDELEALLRHRIATAVHTGALRPGDRLPSLRELTGEINASRYAVCRAYRVLQAEGLIEMRERSGVFVAPWPAPGDESLGETADWLTGVLVGAAEHQIRITYLPELLRDWTASVSLRCACAAEDTDSAAAPCTEVTRQFGVDAQPVFVERLRASTRDRLDPGLLPGEIRDADVLITTIFLAPEVRGIADALAKPLIIARVNPDHVRAVEQRVRREILTVVCADRRFGERVRSLWGGAHRERVRVVLAEDRESLEALDPEEPVLLTIAARERLGSVAFRLLVPHSPAFSLEFARDLSRALIQLHLQAGKV